MSEEIFPPILLTEKTAGVLRITLNRPDQRNALSRELINQLTTALLNCQQDSDVRAVVIAGAGKAFCAGHDLHELLAMDTAQRQQLLADCSRLMMLIQQTAQPVIAEVQGIATAAGCQLVASCDLAVAAKTATFATPGVNIGLFCSTPAVALSRAVPTKKALKMLFTGEPESADEALLAGLVSEVVEDHELLAATSALAQLIVDKSASCIAAGKQAFYRQQGLPLEQAYADASAEMVARLDSPAAKEGINAFLQKRPAHWPS